MRILSVFLCSLGILSLIGCTAVKVPATNQYQLSAYSGKSVSRSPNHVSLQVTPTDAVANYQTQQMLYIKKPYELDAFVKNSWKNPPADMLYPLLIKSLQQTHFFFAVTSSIYTEQVDYRLDTQLLALEQNFLRTPSFLHFSAKVTLVRISDSQVIGSRIIDLQIPCSLDTPYGGVMAANRATQQFTAIVNDFVIAHLRG